MTRPKKTSGRTTTPGTTDSKTNAVVEPDKFPSLRVRKPFIFWFVVIGAVSMALSVVATFVIAIASA